VSATPTSATNTSTKITIPARPLTLTATQSPTVLPTVLLTPTFPYTPPFPTSPEGEQQFTDSVTLQWSWERALNAGEVFEILAWQDGSAIHEPFATTTEQSYFLRFDLPQWKYGKQMGLYFWAVRVKRASDGRFLSLESNAARFRIIPKEKPPTSVPPTNPPPTEIPPTEKPPTEPPTPKPKATPTPA